MKRSYELFTYVEKRNEYFDFDYSSKQITDFNITSTIKTIIVNVRSTMILSTSKASSHWNAFAYIK